jgi:hypothetical protein
VMRLPLRVSHWFHGHEWQERRSVTPGVGAFKFGSMEGSPAIFAQYLRQVERMTRGETVIERFCICGAHYVYRFLGIDEREVSQILEEVSQATTADQLRVKMMERR